MATRVRGPDFRFVSWPEEKERTSKLGQGEGGNLRKPMRSTRRTHRGKSCTAPRFLSTEEGGLMTRLNGQLRTSRSGGPTTPSPQRRPRYDFGAAPFPPWMAAGWPGPKEIGRQFLIPGSARLRDPSRAPAGPVAGRRPRVSDSGSHLGDRAILEGDPPAGEQRIQAMRICPQAHAVVCSGQIAIALALVYRFW